MCRRCAYHFSLVDPVNGSGSGAKSRFLGFGPYLKNYMYELHEWWLKSKVLSCATFFITTPKSSDVFMRTLWLKNWKIHIFWSIAPSDNISLGYVSYQLVELSKSYISFTGCYVLCCVSSALCCIIYDFPLYVSILSNTCISVNC